MKLKILLQIIIFFIAFGLLRTSVFAADANISCNFNGCVPNTVAALFPGSIAWIPGLSVSKTIEVQNITGFKQSVGLYTQNITVTGGLDTVLDMTIRQTNGNITIFSGSLNTFFATPSFTLDTLDSSKTETYIFTITMPSSAGNQYQQKSAVFDMKIVLTEIQLVADNSKNGPPPAGFSNSSTGTSNSQSFTSGPQVLGFTTGGGEVGEGGGGEGGVLGAATPSAEGETGQPALPGGETLGTGTCSSCLSWPFPFIQIIGLIIYFFGFMKGKVISVRSILIAILFSLGVYGSYLLVNKPCIDHGIFIQSSSFICKYLLIMMGTILGVIIFIAKAIIITY